MYKIWKNGYFPMKTIGIIAEFNPFHEGHRYLIEKCKESLGADRCIVVMSGDFVQRGAPAITDKFSRARMALKCGADLVLELPIYYSTGSAEYFAQGAVSILNRLGCVDYLCFGSEHADLDKLDTIAGILNSEPGLYKEILEKELKEGKPYPAASASALAAVIKNSSVDNNIDIYRQIFSSPNSILAIEYLKALRKQKSRIKPYTIERIGQPYHSDDLGGVPSASGVRARIFTASDIYTKKHAKELLGGFMPDEAISEIASYQGSFMSSNDLSHLLKYKLTLEKSGGYTDYLDVNKDISNLIEGNLDGFESFSDFCSVLKSKNLVYTRISRSLLHILLNITKENMHEYKKDSFTSYARVLGLRADSSDILARAHESSAIPIIDRPKTAKKLLSPLQKRLFDETLTASSIYNSISKAYEGSEYSLKPVIL